MEKRLPVRTKVLYGVGELVVSAKNATLNQYLLFFYVDVLRVSPVLVGGALFLGRLWDAVTDPLVGYVSDTTRSRFGRRKPYLLASALPLGVLLFFLFAPPVQSPWLTAVYLACAYILLMTAFTFFATPYLALGAELTDDPHERTTVVQVRSLFGVVGSMIGGVLPLTIVHQFEAPRTGFAVMGALLGSLLSATALVSALGVRENRRSRPPKASLAHFRKGLGHTLRNREFRIVFGTFCLMTVALSLGNSLQIFVVKYWLGLYQYFPWIVAVFALSFVASFPFWAHLARRVGKRQTMRFGLFLGCFIPLGWLLLPPHDLSAMLAFASVGGFSTGSVTVVISSAMDAVDLDEWNTGERREGAYFGIWTLGLKSAAAIGALLGGVLLRLVGFESESNPAPEAIRWLLLILGPLQASAHLFGLVALRNFQIDSHALQDARLRLLERRAADAPAAS